MIGYITTFKDFINEKNDVIIKELIKQNPDADSSQIEAWKVLLDDIKTSTSITSICGDLLIGIEYHLPIENMGVDFFVCGKNNAGKNCLYIIESKQWNDSYIKTLKFSNYREFEKTLHPQLQVHRHYLAIKDYLSLGNCFDTITPILYVKNASIFGLNVINESKYSISSIKTSNNLSEILSVIDMNLKKGPSLSKKDFLDAEYYPSKGIISAMNSIVTKETPFILTDEQEQAIIEITKAINNGKKIIRITGPAGSGKTAILLNLYVSLLNRMETTGYKPYFVSGAQNTALYRSLYPSVQSSFSYSFPLPRMVNSTTGPKSIILMDEAQHNESGIMTKLLNAGATMVVCYDPNQTINANNSLAELSNFEKRDDFLKIELSCCIRYNGSEKFEENVNKFLSGKMEIDNDELFDFRIFNSLNDIITATESLIRSNPDSTVAVTGLLSNDADEIIRNSNGKLFTNWGNKKETEWIPYIQNKNYKNLYGGSLWVGTWWLPGLDVDYIVLIVGGDAKLTKNGIVAVPEQAKHYAMMVSIAEDMGLPNEAMRGFGNYQKASNIISFINQYSNTHIKEEFLKRFSALLRNNYYIMMTRARKGCFVYFVNN